VKRLRLQDRLLLGLAFMGDRVADIIEGGSRAYRQRKLFPWYPADKQRKSFLDAVRRLLQTDCIEKQIKNKQPYFCLTAKGKNKLFRRFSLLSLQQKSWDKKWRLVIYDFPEGLSYVRDSLRKKLKELGFGKWQRSVYISPYDFVDDMVEFFKSKKIFGPAQILTAEHYQMGEAKDFARKIWELDDLNHKYENIYQHINKNNVGKLMDVYLNLIEKDPFLPQELLPENWWADKVRKKITRLI